MWCVLLLVLKAGFSLIKNVSDKCASVCQCLQNTLHRADGSRVARNQYLSGKHGNNASACVCCTLVIKYWLSGLQELSAAVKSSIGGLPGACRSDDGGAFVSDVNVVEPCGCLSWNPATNSRCQNVSLAVAVTSVWESTIRRRETQKERCLAQLFSGHFFPPFLPCLMPNPEMLSECSSEHSAAFLQFIAFLQWNHMIKSAYVIFRYGWNSSFVEFFDISNNAATSYM